MDVDADGVVVKWFVTDSGQVLKSQFTTVGPQGPVRREVHFSDYRPVDGLTLPFSRVTRDNGEVVVESRVKEIKVNPEVDPKLFQKP